MGSRTPPNKPPLTLWFTHHAGKEDVLLPVCVVATHIALVVGDQVARGDEVPGFTVIVGLKIFSKSAKKYIKIRFINQKGFPSNNFAT